MISTSTKKKQKIRSNLPPVLNVSKKRKEKEANGRKINRLNRESEKHISLWRKHTKLITKGVGKVLPFWKTSLIFCWKRTRKHAEVL